MAKSGSIVARKMVEFLTHPIRGWVRRWPVAEESGVPSRADSAANILNQNVSFELSERSLAVKYPVVQVYADRVRNLLTEKFRTFSGKIRTVAEVRVSQDRLEGIEEACGCTRTRSRRCWMRIAGVGARARFLRGRRGDGRCGQARGAELFADREGEV